MIVHVQVIVLVSPSFFGRDKTTHFIAIPNEMVTNRDREWEIVSEREREKYHFGTYLRNYFFTYALTNYLSGIYFTKLT